MFDNKPGHRTMKKYLTSKRSTWHNVARAECAHYRTFIYLRCVSWWEAGLRVLSIRMRSKRIRKQIFRWSPSHCIWVHWLERLLQRRVHFWDKNPSENLWNLGPCGAIFPTWKCAFSSRMACAKGCIICRTKHNCTCELQRNMMSYQ